MQQHGSLEQEPAPAEIDSCRKHGEISGAVELRLQLPYRRIEIAEPTDNLA